MSSSYHEDLDLASWTQEHLAVLLSASSSTSSIHGDGDSKSDAPFDSAFDAAFSPRAEVVVDGKDVPLVEFKEGLRARRAAAAGGVEISWEGVRTVPEDEGRPDEVRAWSRG